MARLARQIMSAIALSCLKEGEVPKYASLSVNEHLAERFRATRVA